MTPTVVETQGTEGMSTTAGTQTSAEECYKQQRRQPQQGCPRSPSANNSRDTNNGRNLSDIRYVISSRTPATAKTPTIAWMIEIEGAPATVVMPTAEGTTIMLETSGTGRML